MGSPAIWKETTFEPQGSGLQHDVAAEKPEL